MVLAPPTGGFFLDRHAVVEWAMIPACVSILGLLVTLVWSGVAKQPVSASPSAELPSGP
jgi:hypothetical protein